MLACECVCACVRVCLCVCVHVHACVHDWVCNEPCALPLCICTTSIKSVWLSGCRALSSRFWIFFIYIRHAGIGALSSEFRFFWVNAGLLWVSLGLFWVDLGLFWVKLGLVWVDSWFCWCAIGVHDSLTSTTLRTLSFPPPLSYPSLPHPFSLSSLLRTMLSFWQFCLALHMFLMQLTVALWQFVWYCVCTQTHNCTCIHMHIYTNAHTHVYTSTHTYMCTTYTHAKSHTRTHEYNKTKQKLYTHKHTYTHTSLYFHSGTTTNHHGTCTYIYTHIYTHIQIHINTHAHTTH